MDDDYLVRHCAPTMAGIKTANLFTCPFESRDTLMDAVRRINRRLKNKGLRVLPLRFYENRVLIYTYRPKRLMEDLSHAVAEHILKQRGYPTENCEKCICHLVQNLQQQKEFPHEIGLFLGYPPEDVRGFLEYGPDCCKCTGCWKVYGDAESAQKKFAQYKKCSKVYWDQWAKGNDIERLTVAG